MISYIYEKFNKFIIYITSKIIYILKSLIQFIFLESLEQKKISLFNCINNFVDFFINKPVIYFFILLFIFLIFVYILFYNKFIYNLFDNNKLAIALKDNHNNFYNNKISEIDYNYNKVDILSKYTNDTVYYKFCLFVLSILSFTLILLFFLLNNRSKTSNYGFYGDKNDKKYYLFYYNHDKKNDKKNDKRGEYDTNLFNTLSFFFKFIFIGIFLLLSLIFIVCFILFFYKFFNFAHNLYTNIILFLFFVTVISLCIYLFKSLQDFIKNCTTGVSFFEKEMDVSTFNGIIQIFINFIKSLTCTIILILFFIPCIVFLLINKAKYELKITLPITYFYFFIILLLFLLLFLSNKFSNILKNSSNIFNSKVTYNLLNYDFYDKKLYEPIYIKKYIKLKNFNSILNIPDHNLTIFKEKKYEHIFKKYLHKFLKMTFVIDEGFVTTNNDLPYNDIRKDSFAKENNSLTSSDLNDKFINKFNTTKKYFKDYLEDVINGNYIENSIDKNNFQIYNYIIKTINNYEINFDLYINAGHNNNNNEIQILNFCKRPIISYKNNNILFYFYGYKFPTHIDLNYNDPSYNTNLPTYNNTNTNINIDLSNNLYNLFTLKNIKYNKFNNFNIKYNGTYISIYLNNRLIFNEKFKLNIIDLQKYSIINNNISIGNNITDISYDLYNNNIQLLKLNGLEAQIKNFYYRH